MKSHRFFAFFALLLFGCALLLIACSPPSPPTEIPITTSSQEARQLFIQGRDKSENVEILEAQKLFDQAIAKDSNFARAYLAWAGTGGGTEVSRKYREKAMSLIGLVSPGEKLLLLRSQAYADGKPALGKAYLDSLHIMFPKDKRVKYMLGLYYRGQLDYKNAVKYYEEAVSIDSLFAAPYNQLGYDNVELGNIEAAEKAFKTYVRLLPNRPNPLDSYAEFLRMQGRYEESIAQYKKVLEVGPTFIASMNGLGDCYVFMGKPDKARECYQELIDKGPQISDRLGGYFSKAITFVHEGKIPEAVKALDEYGAFGQKANEPTAMISCLVSQGWVLLNFGKAQEGFKKYEDAIQLAKTATLQEPTRKNILFWSNNWMTQANADIKKMSKAKECLAAFSADVANRGNPGEKDAVAVSEGYIALMEGRYDEALSKFAGVPPDPMTLCYQGLTCMKKGNKEGAKKFADKIMKWNTNGLDLAIARNRAKAWL
jgi:tetratricopeptide (TPR) repeat protein